MEWQLKDVSVYYDDKPALRNVCCSIQSGQWISVIGQTGAGKSTFVKLLKGLVPLSAGQYLINSQPVSCDAKGNASVISDIGYVFQYPEHQLFETTVYRELAFGPKQQGLSPRKIKDLIAELLPVLGLSESIVDLAPFQLSGGMKRRVAIASILMMNPRMLIVDEPAAGLDPVSRTNLLQYLKQWQEQDNHTLIMVTHQMEDVAEYSDEVIVLHDGRLIGQTDPRSLFLDQTSCLDEIGLSLPESVQLLRMVEELSGEKILVENCREQHIFERVQPFLHLGSSKCQITSL